MPKTSKEIISDLQGYFNDASVNGGRWKLLEVSAKFNRSNKSIEILTVLVPIKEAKGLDVLG